MRVDRSMCNNYRCRSSQGALYCRLSYCHSSMVTSPSIFSSACLVHSLLLVPIVMAQQQCTLRLMRDATLGTGAYGQVCKATLDELPCAAKLLHPILVDPNKPRNRTRFEQECRFLSEIRHPNIVQYLGVAHDGETGLPVLLMELMDDSLTHFLEQSEEPLAYHVQVNISHDIALAVAFLHLNRIVHRDLSSNNVLLIGAGSRAKVTDFGMSKLSPRMTGLTKCPGTPAYMSPEAMFDPPVYTEKLDCFQTGVLMIQTITRKFPDPGPAMNRVRDARYPTGWANIPVPEVERRQSHLSLIPRTHPMLCVAVDCLKDMDSERPSAQQICRYLSALKEAPQYGQSLEGRGAERDGEFEEKEELIQQLREGIEERDREVREREEDIERLQSQLQRKEGEMREREREIVLKVEENQRLQTVIQEKDQTIHQLQQTQQSAPSCTCLVSGPGLQSATASHPTHVIVEVSDSSGRPLPWQQNVTAELVLQSTSQATPTSGGRWPWSKKTLPKSDQPPAVAAISPSRYEVSYTAVRRGQHKLHVRVNGSEINGSPFTMTVNLDPTQLGSPVGVVTDLISPYGIAINSCGKMVVTERGGHQVSVFDIRGRRVRTFGSRGDRPEQMILPAGIAVDDVDNIYVSSCHKLQKFTSSGELIKCVGRRGSKEREFAGPRGVTIHSNQVYVCDCGNHRIQVFDLDLNFIQSIGSHGKGRGEFDRPHDVAFDTAGNMYVAEFRNERVQVMDSSGQFIRAFGQEGEGKLRGPTALHIADKYVYVSDHSQHRIAVYETSGHFVTSFGRRGLGEGELHNPYCVTSCVNGFIHVCDHVNNRIQIF